MKKLQREVIASISNEKVQQLYKGVRYLYGQRGRKCPYKIMAKALASYGISVDIVDDHSLIGSNKALRRWLNGGLQKTLKDCAKCVIANGNYKGFMRDDYYFHHACL